MDELALFTHALDLETPEEREAFLQQACGSNQSLRARVAALLKSDRVAGSFLQGAPPGLCQTEPSICPDRPGAVIGNYKLLEQIGEGGMGLVYMAEQQQPVRRLVALKLVKPGMDSKQVIARFEAERQALALMDHPNIARVLDAGTTESGRPFFVMDLVRGLPINELCDQKHLSVRERLELFIQVCQAVQHAHQKGVIHRDLKPTNILVTMHDSVAVPRVIDFGIAKALGQALTEHTLHTGFAQLVGTPLYMSPEQAELNQLGVDTRSDVYSLGVLLYELLTGTTPFDKDRLKSVDFDEMRRIIREEQPETVSARIARTKSSRQTPSAASSSPLAPSPQPLAPRLSELDWIVMKTLEKDRDRRYETAKDFAADVQRYLNDEPVQACPPSLGYRARKFVRRNKGPVWAAAVGLLLLVGGIVGTTTGLVQAEGARRAEADQRKAAERERDAKETARQEAIAHLKTARRAIGQLTRMASEHAAVEPRLEQTWRDLLQDALQFYQELFKAQNDDPVLRQEVGLAYSRLGKAYERLGENGKAEQALHQGIVILDGLAAEGKLDPEGRYHLISTSTHLGWLLSEIGRYDERVLAHQQALQRAEKLATEFRDIARYQDLLASACINLGNTWAPTRPHDAEALYRRAITLSATPTGNRHYLGSAHLALGGLLREAGRLDEAEDVLRRALALFKELAEDMPHRWQGRDRLADAHLHLGRVLACFGRAADAEQAVRQAVDLRERQRADFPKVLEYQESLISDYASLVLLLASTGNVEEANKSYRKLSGLVPERAEACNNLAWLLATCCEPSIHDPARAVNLARKAVELAPRFGKHWRTLGAAHFRAGDLKGAVAALEKSMERPMGGDSFDLYLLAMAHWRLGNKEEARRRYDQAVQWMEKNQPNHEELRRFRVEAAELLEIPKQG